MQAKQLTKHGLGNKDEKGAYNYINILKDESQLLSVSHGPHTLLIEEIHSADFSLLVCNLW